MAIYPNIDTARLNAIETKYGIKCLDTAPFQPTKLVKWKCNKDNHEWTASYIELQISGGCFQCNPGDIATRGNATFLLDMSFTMAKLENDFRCGILQPLGYLPDSAFHISIAAFFFNAVRTEFVLKRMSEKHTGLGLGKRIGLCRKYKQFNTVELANNMCNCASNNISKFKMPNMTHEQAHDRYKELRDNVIKYIEARNKIAHGYSKYPISKKHNYNSEIADLIKSIGKNELTKAYSTSMNFLDISERLLDTSDNGIDAGNKLLWELFNMR